MDAVNALTVPSVVASDPQQIAFTRLNVHFMEPLMLYWPRKIGGRAHEEVMIMPLCVCPFSRTTQKLPTNFDEVSEGTQCCSTLSLVSSGMGDCLRADKLSNSAFHPSGVGKWIPAIAGNATAGMAHSACGWTCGCAGRTVKSLENTCHIWALLRWWFTTKRRYISSVRSLPLPKDSRPYAWIFLGFSCQSVFRL